MFSKFKKISELIFCLGVLCVSVIFFAVIVFTPVSNIFCSFLKNDFISAFKSNNQENSNININKTLLILSFPGINEIYDDFNNSDAFDFDYNNKKNISDEPPADYIYNPYENIPLKDDDSILSIYDLYAYYQAASGVKIEEAAQPSENLEIPPDYYKITPVNFSGQKTKIPKLLTSNETSFNIDLFDYISKKYSVSPFDPQKKDEPVILILDTHATESYVEEGTEYYSPPFTAERSTDINSNVVLIATRLRKKLEEYNIPVIQSTKLHDAVSYRDSYIRSLETMNEYLDKYPSIRYIIDVHRDSMITSSGEKYRPAIKINGRDCSQVMLVIGTDDGGGYHPNWRDNLTFAAYLQQKMNDKYPMFARPVNLRNARFNQHTTKGSIILEVGSCGSSFDEALYAADLFGECLAELLLEQNQN
ncbi:MAG: stage II sporulation protein P [Oscillospiraceae bacterium]|nr:stage II sporulation protein P [Oscillospiraceae bacterium]